ncbi:hypothetical protein CHLRE_03g151600v5 [Chlamydomonas reinhardtii]|uniref:Uncharacterized protein n=1 Tax=Chlamydomonas reinhardtii TaxID=3055 RepID=A8J2M0_CHLRE|nr:uncharacterized protein CHLRE_03g151600v5 [Chlamydomonas reinhardtii]PNW84619.1 hypothetical protein CHLRE_03g151600v5 [Chlamydomonas reinhardtii]|eukprot:XP_001695544.1 predicted protein [Chlamydomonas reinhardtii]
MNSLLARKGVASLAQAARRTRHVAWGSSWHLRASRALIAKASQEPGPSGESDVLAEVGRRAVDFWDKLDTKQRIYTVVAGGALVLSLPQIVGVLLIPLERLLVGGLLAVEQAFALLVLSSVRVIALVGAAGLVLVGLYLFLFPKKGES